MPVIRFKATLKNNNDMYRIIDIPDTFNFNQLHHAMLKSVEFEDGEFASFYLNYEDRKKMVEICLSDMQKDEDCLLMKNMKIKDIVKKKGERLTYIYDFLNMWTFDLEVTDIVTEDKNNKYPLIVEKFGAAPKQEDMAGFSLEDLSDEDLAMMKDMMSDNEELFDADYDFDKDLSIDDFDDFDDFDDDYGGKKGRSRYDDDDDY